MSDAIQPLDYLELFAHTLEVVVLLGLAVLFAGWLRRRVALEATAAMIERERELAEARVAAREARVAAREARAGQRPAAAVLPFRQRFPRAR